MKIQSICEWVVVGVSFMAGFLLLLVGAYVIWWGWKAGTIIDACVRHGGYGCIPNARFVTINMVPGISSRLEFVYSYGDLSFFAYGGLLVILGLAIVVVVGKYASK